MATSEESPNDASPLRDKLIPDSAGPNISQSDREGSSPLVPEKPSEDGYNWRKYGQKNIKGNDFVRCYYKCSFLNCQVKKQVEHAPDGRIIETTYFGEHDHPKPQPSLPVDVPSPRPAQVKVPDQRPGARDGSLIDDKAPKKAYGALVTQVSADTAATPLSAGAKDDSNSNRKQTPKRRKKVAESGERVVDKPCGDSRHVVETVSAVDILNDGYRWRKYGQKLVRGNSNPRSYYRCSNPGCPAKKQVERASHDPRIVVTAYEGQHDHDVPPIQMILPHNPENTVSEPRNGAEPKRQEGTSPQDGRPTLAEPTGAIPKAEEEEISSEAMNDAKPKAEGSTPQHTNTRSTNEAKEEVDQALDFESSPEKRQEKEMKGKDDSLADPEITKTKQPVLISKTEELQRPDTGVSC